MPTTPCPTDCGHHRAPRQYLCACWFELPVETRRVLSDPAHSALG